MRYNTYRQYKTLSGYNTRTPTIRYLEKNYQFQWRSYDLISNIPSDIFAIYYNATSTHQKGFRLSIVINTNNQVEDITVQKQPIGLTTWESLYVVSFEPNSYLFSIEDPDKYSDGSADLRIEGLNTDGDEVTFYTVGTGSSANKYISTYSASWTIVPSRNTTGIPNTVVNFTTGGSYISGVYASNIQKLRIGYTVDTNDTQSSITPINLYVPTFVPDE